MEDVFLFCSIMTDDKTSTLLIKECTIDDEGDYEVVIDNVSGEVSHMFEIIVNAEAPKILQALPEVVEVSLHKPATLTVKFDSPTQSKVTWLANGVQLEHSRKYSISTSVNETTLEIADVLIDDTEMIYNCQVKNIAGHVDTATSLTIPCRCLHIDFDVLVIHTLVNHLDVSKCPCT